jgi:hypothetical protein
VCERVHTHIIVDLYEAEYLCPPKASEVHHILQENEARGFLGCSEVQIACIGSGHHVPWLTMESIEDIRGSSPSFLKRLQARAYDYGTRSLGCQDRTMTST